MIPVAMIAAFPPPVGGQSLAAKLLYDGLSPDEFDVFKLDLAESIGGDPFLKRFYQLAGIEIKLISLCMREPELIVYLQLGHGKVSIIRDLVYIATASAFKKSCVAHVHGSGFRAALDALPAPIRELDKIVLKKLKAAVVLSDSLKKMFDHIVDEERIFAIDNGIDPEFVAMTDNAPVRTCHENQFHILFLSNFLTLKGFSTLLRTAVLAQNREKCWHFTFIGEKIENQDVDIDGFISDYQLNNVTVRSVVQGKDKHDAYQSADVFVLPSIYEGQPLCILEAMFESLPVVTTKVGGIPEIFATDETCVEYVEPNNPEQLFHVFDRLEKQPELRLSMGQHARQIAQSRFLPQKHIDIMSKLFRDVFEHKL